jgi:prepilin signal peptidase PulO-like enzyme (type II secretory pathway)
MYVAIIFFIFSFGLIIGSFLNVVIHRVPLEQSVVFPRSACPKCGHVIRWYENIPVVSYIFLRGKCSQCKTKISIRYPLIELFCGFIALLLFPDTISQQSLVFWFVKFSIACSFLAHFLIDVEHKILPDKINLYLLAIIGCYVLLNYPWKYWLIGGAVGFLGPLLITWLFYKIKGQIGLGGGDIKLYGILGLLFGPLGILSTIFLSSFLGAFVGVAMIAMKKMDRDTALPFGPFIIIVAAVQFFAPKVFNFINPFNFM